MNKVQNKLIVTCQGSGDPSFQDTMNRPEPPTRYADKRLILSFCFVDCIRERLIALHKAALHVPPCPGRTML